MSHVPSTNVQILCINKCFKNHLKAVIVYCKWICKDKAGYTCNEFAVCGFKPGGEPWVVRDRRDEQQEKSPGHTVEVRESSLLVRRL